MTNISIIGAGAWGTALAQVFAGEGHKVFLYARDPGLAEKINRTRLNDVYLPGVSLHQNVEASSDMASASEADIVVMATPAQFFRETLQKLKGHIKKQAPLINAAKGMEMATGALLSRVAMEVAPGFPYFVLSGPTFAAEVARGLPTAVTLASKADDALSLRVAQALSGKMFKLYLSKDPIGAEVGGALKNVIAIACGISDGKKLGHNARAAVMTRGMAEIRRFGLTLGAQSETFLGLSGIGDMALTCSSTLSRNYTLGLEIGEGKSLREVMASRRAVTEGVTTTIAISDYAKIHSIEMPICTSVNAMLHRGVSAEETLKNLMSRPLTAENA